MDESAGPTLPSALLYVAGRPRVHLLLWTREAEETWAVNHAMESQVPSGATICPDFALAVRTLADGYPDPKQAGPCGWISVAYEIEAVPAAVSVH